MGVQRWEMYLNVVNPVSEKLSAPVLSGPVLALCALPTVRLPGLENRMS